MQDNSKKPRPMPADPQETPAATTRGTVEVPPPSNSGTFVSEPHGPFGPRVMFSPASAPRGATTPNDED